MSCFIMSPAPLATLADYLEAQLNMGYDFFGMEAPAELRRALDVCADHAGFMDGHEIFGQLYSLNFRAYSGRYGHENEPAEIPHIPDYRPVRGYSRPEYSAHSFHVAPWHYEMSKRIDCFIYQCSEDVNRDSELLAGMIALQQVLRAFIVQHIPEYLAHPWGA